MVATKRRRELYVASNLTVRDGGPMVVFMHPEEVESWYFCERCQRTASGFDWDWDSEECPQCGTQGFAMIMGCNWAVQHQNGQLDDLSDCVESRIKDGEVAHCDDDCGEDWPHPIVELVREPFPRRTA